LASTATVISYHFYIHFRRTYAMEDEITEGKLFGTFEKYDEFSSLQQALLSVDLAVEPDKDEDLRESDLLRKLSNIVSYPVCSYLVLPFTPRL
jgi:tubulin-specific chaperone D